MMRRLASAFLSVLIGTAFDGSLYHLGCFKLKKCQQAFLLKKTSQSQYNPYKGPLA